MEVDKIHMEITAAEDETKITMHQPHFRREMLVKATMDKGSHKIMANRRISMAVVILIIMLWLWTGLR